MKNLVLALLLLLPLSPAKADCFKTCETSQEGLQLIEFFEGFSPFAYNDVGGKPTIGYGHLIVKGERIPQPLLGDAANQLLATDLQAVQRGLNTALLLPQPQSRFDALSSFAFNVGVGACVRSHLMRYTNDGFTYMAQVEFGKWVNVQGKPQQGLIIRRRAEAALYAR